MLKSLSIQNYALIEELKMTPSPQLNIITGETGAGKSIMLGAVGLMLGNRADTKSLLNEDRKCIIEGVFDLQSYALQPLFQEEDLDYEDVSIIRREISPNGKSRAFINDTPVTLETLRRLGLFLMDVHSQHDSLLLTTNAFQLQVIDLYAGNQELLERYKIAYRSFQQEKKNYEQLLNEAGEIKKAGDYNNFLLEELEKARLELHEQETLEEELEILENSEEIKLKLHSAVASLSDGELAILTMLRDAVNNIKAVGKFAEAYETLHQRAESCFIELKDIADELETAEDQVAFDPEKIQATKERLSLIYQLQQKHQVNNIEDLLAIQQNLQTQVEKVLNLDDELAQAKLAVDKAEANAKKISEDLSSKRSAVFEAFEEKIVGLVKSLGMPDATFRVTREATVLSSDGIDDINFLFSANKGIKPQSLKTAASGGEFSRLMFCIKYILADKTALPTIVFDEIDTGISGEIALKMVHMMKKMAGNHQVIVISHLPQIAAKGDTHYYVYKDNSATKTISKIRLLSQEERITEIAKMIGGENASAVAFESARELMQI